MQEVARYECVYHRNSKDFKNKNRKANCWEIIGEKFKLSAAEDIRTAYVVVEEVLSVVNTKFSDQSVEGPKFLSIDEYFANPKPMFSTVKF